ncbi:DNA polymerase III subunit gamma/tau [Candidatus Peregrinibacteria bacterium]|nr:DNA polymerase III subunit gamma/tau [Candidatus Peregrinibacteria bacterium]
MPEDVSFYRKYRPQVFEDLVGQEHIKTTLLNALRKRRLAHAYLFCGPRGTGKTTTARLIAKGFNCLNLQKNAEPCNTCEICVSITEGRLIDVIEIDAASNRGIDEIRDLREKVRFAPTHAAKKVYIIDEVHMLTKEAFNALLKMLEEPPSHVNFILATTEAYKVPETIISRCQRFDFQRITIDVIVNRLKAIAEMEKISADEHALKFIARAAEGGLRDAIGLFEQMTVGNSLTFEHVKEYLGLVGEKTLSAFIACLLNRDVPHALEYINTLYQEGADLTQFNKECLGYLRDHLLSAVSKDAYNDMLRYLELISAFQEAHETLKSAIIPQLPLEMAIIKSCFGDRTHRAIRTAPTETETLPKVVSQAAQSAQQAQPTHSASPPTHQPSFDTLTFDLICQHWPRVLEHIKTPSTRMSLSQGTLTSLTAQTLTMNFNSRFHLEKVEAPKNRQEISTALFSVFQKHILLEYVLREIMLDPTTSALDRKTSFDSLPTVEKSEEVSGVALAEKTAELFGGVVEEE